MSVMPEILFDNTTMFTEPEPPKNVDRWEWVRQPYDDGGGGDIAYTDVKQRKQEPNPDWASWNQRKQTFETDKARMAEEARKTEEARKAEEKRSVTPEIGLLDPSTFAPTPATPAPTPAPPHHGDPPPKQLRQYFYENQVTGEGDIERVRTHRIINNPAYNDWMAARLKYLDWEAKQAAPTPAAPATPTPATPTPATPTPATTTTTTTDTGEKPVTPTSSPERDKLPPEETVEIVRPDPTREDFIPRDPNLVNKPVLDIKGQQAVAIPNITPNMLYDPEGKEVQQDELLSETGKFVDPTGTYVPQAEQAVYRGVDSPEQRTSLIEDVERTYSNIPTAQAAKGTITTNNVIDPNQVVDERTRTQMFERGSLAQAKTQELALEASTAYQIEKLTEGIETGNFPPWASPTVRKVNEIMNQRGLGASSMAAAAIAQGLMESAIPIANSDAQKAATLQIQNLNNQQQTALANAATIAAMDRQNLDNRMKAAQQNAQSFLQMDLTNVANQQSVNTLNHQSRVQSLFTDSAAENARNTFNAKTENQVNQYYDQLGATVELTNSARDLANQQYNIKEKAAIDTYNSRLRDAREKFNSNMATQIDQFNTQWRRSTNTYNTAEQNKANQQNAATLLGITVKAQQDLWQKYRDDISYAFTATENARARSHQIAHTVLNQQFEQQLVSQAYNHDDSVRLSNGIGNLASKVLDAGIEYFTKSPTNQPIDTSLLTVEGPSRFGIDAPNIADDTFISDGFSGFSGFQGM